MSIEGGRQIFNALASDTTIKQTIRDQIAEHSGSLYDLIDSKSTNNEDLSRSLAQLTNVFRTYTHSSHHDLSDTQRLMFQHAVIDITDDVRTMIAERAQQRQSEEAQQSTAFWVACKVADWMVGTDASEITDAQVLEGIEGLQAAMENPELEISLRQVKEVLGLVLENQGRGAEATEVQGMGIKDLVKYLESVHQEKKSQANEMLPGPSNLEKAYNLISQAMGVIKESDAQSLEDVRQVLVQFKDDQVKSQVSGFKPETLFEGRSFKQLTEDLVSDQLKSRGVEGTPLGPLAKAGAEHIRSNLAENLSRISDERNLARIGIVMNQCVGDVAEALNGMSTDDDDQQLLNHLGIKATPQEYKKQVEQRGAQNLAKLVSKNPNQTSGETRNVGLKLWRFISRGIKNTAFKLVRSSIETGVKQSGSLEMLGGLSPAPENIEQLKKYASHLGLEEQVAKFEGHSEIVMLYMFDHLLQEMGNIAAESQGKADPNVSGFETADAAADALKSSSENLGRRLAAIQPSQSAGMIQQGLLSIAKIFGSNVAQKQGSGDSVLDLLTPAVKELGPAWKKWLTE